ncbi:hypothetical protein IMZ48_02445 [Candidatus Bathyarchaeota archaeon]|nr:hypothetical protein [Candidatus Bathyarchaeota archaeon]
MENDFYPLSITTDISTFFPDYSTANRHDPSATIASPNRRPSPSNLDISAAELQTQPCPTEP